MVDFEKGRQLLATGCPHDPEEITLDKHLVTDLEIDSFGLMDMVIAFENEFNLELPDRDLSCFPR
jgi:acyl carrier protein